MADIKKPMSIKLETLEDLVIWMISSSENQNGTIYYSKQLNKHIFSIYIVFPNYYEFRGLPTHGYVILDEAPQYSFLRCDIRDDIEKSKRISFVNGFNESDSSFGYVQYFPIVKLIDVPDIFKLE